MKYQTYLLKDTVTGVELKFQFEEKDTIDKEKRAFMELMKKALMELQMELPTIQ